MSEKELTYSSCAHGIELSKPCGQCLKARLAVYSNQLHSIECDFLCKQIVDTYSIEQVMESLVRAYQVRSMEQGRKGRISEAVDCQYVGHMLSKVPTRVGE